MKIKNGSTSITTYFVLRDSTNHVPKTDITVTDLDLYYVEYRTAISAPVINCTALAAADSAYSSGGAFNCGRGVYRVDWPNECFNGGVGTRATLMVECSGVDTAFLDVELSAPMDVTTWEGGALPVMAAISDIWAGSTRWTVKKNTEFQVVFDMLDADGNGVTLLTGITAMVSKDGGTWTTMTNEASIAEVGRGAYKITVTATEANCDFIKLEFYHVAAKTARFYIPTQS